MTKSVPVALQNVIPEGSDTKYSISIAERGWRVHEGRVAASVVEGIEEETTRKMKKVGRSEERNMLSGFGMR